MNKFYRFNNKVIKIRGKESDSVLLFSIKYRQKIEAAKYLINQLNETFELGLKNDDDEGGEGLTLIKVKNCHFFTMKGGHGWSSDWKEITRNEAENIIINLASLNKGGMFSNNARFYFNKCIY